MNRKEELKQDLKTEILNVIKIFEKKHLITLTEMDLSLEFKERNLTGSILERRIEEYNDFSGIY